VAGRKVFTSGEILTAADVNSFLMDQSVMVFADSSARSSAIPAASEGMVTFREDQDVVEVFDGSAFKTVGGLVAVESALKTDTFSASLSSGSSVAITDLSITHEVSDPSNKLIIMASIGVNGSNINDTAPSFLLDVDGTEFAVGDALGSRTRVTMGLRPAYLDSGATGVPQSMVWSFTPGAGSKTYSIFAINARSTTQTFYVNRVGDDSDSVFGVRGVSSLVIQEVAV